MTTGFSNKTDKLTSREKFYFYNTLSILIKAVEGHKTTVDLRNEGMIFGTVQQADAFMNITMKDCYFTNPRGDCYKYDMFFVRARNVRSVHIPPHIRMLPAIRKELDKIYKGSRINISRMKKEKKPLTFKQKRIEEKQKEDLFAAEQKLGNTNQDMPSTSQK